MATKVYDPDQVSIVLGGIPISSGFADGEFIKLEHVENDFTEVIGTDGEVTRSKTNDRRVMVTIRLMQSSDANGLLSALRLVDLNAPNGAGIVPFLLKDRQGSFLCVAGKAWIEKAPDASFDRTAKEREWKIKLADATVFHGGN